MADRILSGVLMIVSAVLIYLALGYNPAFLNEPIGPRAYPIAVLALIIALSAWIFLSPRLAEDGGQSGHGLKIALASVAMLGYALVFEDLGYIPATIIFTLAIGKLAEGRTLPTLISGIGLTIAAYLMFAKLLQVSLPLGLWFRG